jgi:hypothetical protein
MTFRRALLSAPLAVLVAVLANRLGFADGHVLGGAFGAGFTSVAFGGTFLVAIAAFAWLVAVGRNAVHAERSLFALLPWGGNLAGTTATLAAGGLAAFASIEAAEGRFPLGSAWSLLCLLTISLVVALGLRVTARWIAAASALVAAVLEHEFRSPGAAHRFALVPARPANSADVAGVRRGRAPPRLA